MTERTLERTVHPVATRVIPKTELRERIREELARLGDDTLLITERGRPLAVVVSVARWNILQETLEDLEDAVAIIEGRSNGDAGRPLDEVLADQKVKSERVHRPARETG